eukprot:CAMPEP_0170518200 /NCGR_PEP_ID=MMETSP0209-20121228/3941_1 /TAXON_ID=665100 ORGANISM="Litonotus pictus, Strain P1" /NCGR_SAMPLE_ID=MMETSP0209 /ASSEMBLY_ACC=CAM_ASM_000301 /LENGTH=2436 /DNA_ID=CAMNT_0010803667 /DNA_START=704 /DNA_END=8014 /DNA_ORIENTATION=-
MMDQLYVTKGNILDSISTIGTLFSYSNKTQKNAQNMNRERNLRDKLSSVEEKLNSLNELRSSVSKSVKDLESSCFKLYEEAKSIFKEMKLLRNYKMEQIGANADVILNRVNSNSKDSNTGNNDSNLLDTFKSNIKVNSSISPEKKGTNENNKTMNQTSFNELVSQNKHLSSEVIELKQQLRQHLKETSIKGTMNNTMTNMNNIGLVNKNHQSLTNLNMNDSVNHSNLCLNCTNKISLNSTLNKTNQMNLSNYAKKPFTSSSKHMSSSLEKSTNNTNMVGSTKSRPQMSNSMAKFNNTSDKNNQSNNGEGMKPSTAEVLRNNFTKKTAFNNLSRSVEKNNNKVGGSGVNDTKQNMQNNFMSSFSVKKGNQNQGNSRNLIDQFKNALGKMNSYSGESKKPPFSQTGNQFHNTQQNKDNKFSSSVTSFHKDKESEQGRDHGINPRLSHGNLPKSNTSYSKRPIKNEVPIPSSVSHSHHVNDSNYNNLPSSVLEFINTIEELQDNINRNSDEEHRSELKKKFEFKKAELRHVSKSLLNSKNFKSIASSTENIKDEKKPIATNNSFNQSMASLNSSNNNNTSINSGVVFSSAQPELIHKKNPFANNHGVHTMAGGQNQEGTPQAHISKPIVKVNIPKHHSKAEDNSSTQPNNNTVSSTISSNPVDKQTIEEQKTKISNLTKELSQINKSVEELNIKYSSLHNDYENKLIESGRFKKDKESADNQIIAFKRENENLQSKINKLKLIEKMKEDVVEELNRTKNNKDQESINYSNHIKSLEQEISTSVEQEKILLNVLNEVFSGMNSIALNDWDFNMKLIQSEVNERNLKENYSSIIEDNLLKIRYEITNINLNMNSRISNLQSNNILATNTSEIIGKESSTNRNPNSSNYNNNPDSINNQGSSGVNIVISSIKELNNCRSQTQIILENEIKDLRTKYIKLSSQVSDNASDQKIIKDLRVKVSDLNKDKDSLEESLFLSKENNNKADKDLINEKEINKRLNSKIEELSKIEDENLKLSNERVSLMKEIIENKDSLNKTIQDLEQSLDSTRLDKEKTMKDNKALLERVRNQEKRISFLENKANTLHQSKKEEKSEIENNYKELTREVNELKANQALLKDDNSRLNKENSSLQTTINSSNQDNEEKNKENNSLRNKIEKCEKMIYALESNKLSLEKEVNVMRDEIEKHKKQNLDKTQNLEDSQNNENKLNDMILNLERTVSSLEKEKEELLYKLQEECNSCIIMKNNNKELQMKLDSHLSEEAGLRHSIDSLNKQINIKDNELKKLEINYNSKCQEELNLSTKTKQKDKELQEASNKIEELKREYKNIKEVAEKEKINNRLLLDDSNIIKQELQEERLKLKEKTLAEKDLQSKIEALKENHQKEIKLLKEELHKELSESVNSDKKQLINHYDQKISSLEEKLRLTEKEKDIESSEMAETVLFEKDKNTKLNSMYIDIKKDFETSRKKNQDLESRQEILIEQINEGITGRDELNTQFISNKEELERIKDVLNERERRLFNSQEELNLLQIDYEQSRKVIEDLKGKNESLKELLNKNSNSLESRLLDYQNQILKLNEQVGEKDKELNSASSNILDLENANSELTKSLGDLNTTLEEKENELKRLSFNNRTVDSQITDITHKYKTNLEENNKLSVENNNLKEESQKLFKAKEKSMQRVKELEDENGDLLGSITNTYYMKDELAKAKRSLELKDEQIIKAEDENTKLKDSTEEASTEKEKMEEQINKLNLEVSTLNSKIASLESEKKVYKAEMKEAMDRLTQFKNDYNTEKENAYIEEENKIKEDQQMRDIQNNLEKKVDELEKEKKQLETVIAGNMKEKEENIGKEEQENEIDQLNIKNQDLSQKVKSYEDEMKANQVVLSEIMGKTRKLDSMLYENKQLKEKDKEFSKKLNEAIERSARGMIPTTLSLNELKQSTDSYLRTVDLLRGQIEEFSENNKMLEEKLNKAMNKIKKYKELNLNYWSNDSKNRESTTQSGLGQNIQTQTKEETQLKGNSIPKTIKYQSEKEEYYTLNIEQPEIDPKLYDILTEKILGLGNLRLKWVLLCEKNISTQDFSYTNTRWIPIESIGGEEALVKFKRSPSYNYLSGSGGKNIGKTKSFNSYGTEIIDKDKEIADLHSINDDLLMKMSDLEEEKYQLKQDIKKLNKELNKAKTNKEVIEKKGSVDDNVLTLSNTNFQQRNSNISALGGEVTFVPQDKYQKVVENFDLEQEKSKSLDNQLTLLRIELEKLKGEKEENLKIQDKKDISEILSKSIEGDLSDYLDIKNNNHNITAGLRKKDSTGNIIKQDNASDNRSISRGGVTPKTDVKNTIASIKSNINLENSYKETINRLEDDHTAMTELVAHIKKELKDTQKDLERYKKKYNEAISLQDSNKSEIVTMLSSFIDKLIAEISLNDKTKELVRHILKILNYSDTEIKDRLEKKKKKGIFG